MPRPRLPQAKAETSGAAAHNPARFKDRKSPKKTRPLGEPYKTMAEDEQAVWAELAREMPWLHSTHRTMLLMASRLTAKLHADTLSVSGMETLARFLSKLGATPTDETKVNHGEDSDEDPSDRFFTGTQ